MSDAGSASDLVSTPPPCVVMVLPPALLIPAARSAVEVYPGNALPHIARAILPPQEAAVLTTKYWGPKPRTIVVEFLDNPTAAFRRIFLQLANSWDCSITFAETTGTGELRLSRSGRGYWSYLGPDILLVAGGQPTMSLQGFTEHTSLRELVRVIVHEVGHTLGMPHEHLRRKFVDRIDRAKAYPYFLRWQGWGKEIVDANVLTPQEESTLLTPTTPDELSIMAYPLPGEIMIDGIPVPGGDRLTASDLAYADLIYPLPAGPTPPVTPPPPPPPPPKPKPPVEPPPKPKPGKEPRATRLYVGKESGNVRLPGGQSRWFRFEVSGMRKYAVATRGKLPLSAYLYGPDDRTLRVAKDDQNSGIGPNAALSATLTSGTYHLEVRGTSGIEEGPFRVKVQAL